MDEDECVRILLRVLKKNEKKNVLFYLIEDECVPILLSVIVF